jgi:hypothetical protein
MPFVVLWPCYLPTNGRKVCASFAHLTILDLPWGLTSNESTTVTQPVVWVMDEGQGIDSSQAWPRSSRLRC